MTVKAESPAPAKPAPRQPAPPTPTRGGGVSRRTTIGLIVGTVVILVVVAGVVVSLAFRNVSLPMASGYGPQTVLPFTGLKQPAGVAVDSAGTLYVTDYDSTTNNSRVLKLAAGSSNPTELPFTGLKWPEGVAVDSAGNLYLTDYSNNRVLKLPVQKAHKDRTFAMAPAARRAADVGRCDGYLAASVSSAIL